MKKKIIILIVFLAVFAMAYTHGQYKKNRMEEYARQNNCTWIYDYYITEEPVCK